MSLNVPLVVAGVIGLLTAPGHLIMGLNKLGPVIKSQQDVHSDTALSGWYQGCFMYAVFGLNYLRLASAPRFALLDKIILVVQASMHVFTVVKMTDVPPKVLSVIMLGALGLGCLQ